MSDSGQMPPTPAPQLSAADKDALLELARDTLVRYLADGRCPPYHATSGALLAPGAVFVTLRQRDTQELRGCRGEVVARRPLAQAVQRMAIASAVDDPRFPPVTADEVAQLHIEISALTPLTPIRPEEVVVGRHGLMITHRGRAGLLLPQVPAEQGWNREAFLRWTCRKAGLPDDAWASPDAELKGFECVVWGEPER
jgi:AmmeMemoRadiSam system protein A